MLGSAGKLIHCPKCGAADIRRSGQPGKFRAFMSTWFGTKAVRCRCCGARFYRRILPSQVEAPATAGVGVLETRLSESMRATGLSGPATKRSPYPAGARSYAWHDADGSLRRPSVKIF
jgi:hypothetical protein